MRDALGKDVAVFGKVPAQSIDALRALMHQKIPGPEHDAVRLLLLVLDRNEAHARPLSRLTDCLGISRVILLPLHERLDLGPWNHPHPPLDPVMSGEPGRARQIGLPRLSRSRSVPHPTQAAPLSAPESRRRRIWWRAGNA